MSLDYTIYHSSSVQDLDFMVSSFTASVKTEGKLFFGKASVPNPINIEILKEYGFRDQYTSKVMVRLSKDNTLKCKKTLKKFLSDYLGESKSVVLLNGEPCSEIYEN